MISHLSCVRAHNSIPIGILYDGKHNLWMGFLIEIQLRPLNVTQRYIPTNKNDWKIFQFYLNCGMMVNVWTQSDFMLPRNIKHFMALTFQLDFVGLYNRGHTWKALRWFDCSRREKATKIVSHACLSVIYDV